MKQSIQEVGFTLVELLIVIALIGVLATALVATLNPIEQVNKARDVRYRNDAAELLAALERYYASTQAYPWVGTTYESEDEFGDTAESVDVGVCAGTACSENGALITSGELKPSFKNKEQFSATAAINKLYVYKESGSDGAVYVCFIPKAGTNRDPEANPNLRLWDVCTTGDTSGCTGFQAPATCTPDATTDWDDASSACFICVPD